MQLQDRFSGCLLGLAAGDAVGTTLEFSTRDSGPPLTDMVGGGPFELRAGQWTDDTSMALCLATSLVQKKAFDAQDQMNRYCNWSQHGYLSSNGRCFDIGTTVSTALSRYLDTGVPYSGPTDPRTAGNGSLMRLAPVVMFCFPDREQAISNAAESSRTTHAAPECLETCRLFAEMLIRAFEGQSKAKILNPVSMTLSSERLRSIANMEYIEKPRSQIRGSGYVVDSIEASLWCFSQTSNFKDAILMAANLGKDADTTAAICGQLAGAHYGKSGIPNKWVEKLTMSEDIEQLSGALLEGD